MEEDDFWDISKELEEAKMELEESEEESEASYADVLLSEPDEECRDTLRGKEYVLPEFYLNHQEKKALEQETFAEEEEKLKEKNWDKQAPETLEEIHRRIDEGLQVEEVEEKVEEREELFEGPAARSEEVPEWLSGQRVSGTIINREVVYDTEGGFVVKVVYKENDEVKTSYYTVSKVEGIEQALDDLASYQPVIEERPIKSSTPGPAPTAEKPQKKKSLLDAFFGKK